MALSARFGAAGGRSGFSGGETVRWASPSRIYRPFAEGDTGFGPGDAADGMFASTLLERLSALRIGTQSIARTGDLDSGSEAPAAKGGFVSANIEPAGGATPPGAAATPTVAETPGPNDDFASAQLLDRAAFAVSANPNLIEDSIPSLTVKGSVATLTERDYFKIELNAGDQLFLDVEGASVNGLDSYLRLYDSNFNLIAFNDDRHIADSGSDFSNGHNMDSQIRFWATQAGTYYFSIGSFEDFSSGTYDINVSVGPASRQDRLLGEVDQLISGYSWDRLDLTFGFPNLASDYPGNPVEAQDGFAPFNTLQRVSTREILGMFADVSALILTENSVSPGWATLRFAMSRDPGSAHAYYPWNSGSEYQAFNSAGSAWFNPAPWNSDPWRNYNQPLRGDFGWRGILHETGHAVGLKHSHDGPPVSIEYDSHEYTVMAYRSYPGQQLGGGGYTNERWGYPQTLMMFDIAALQKIYGADFAANAGDSVYSWIPGAGETFVNGVGEGAVGDGSAEANRVFLTIWDGGGQDTYDLSAFATDAVIDLRPGEWTITSNAQLAHLGDGHYARGNVANALQFEGDARSLIENAIGGSGNDRLIGNDVANRLEGGAGADILIGGLGADVLVGSSGADIFLFESAADSLDDAMDLILGFQSGIDLIDLLAIGPVSLIWSELTDPSNGLLYSMVSVTAGAGDMTIRIEGLVASNDFRTEAGRTYEGTAAEDELFGSAGHDRLDGGLGADRMSGRHGDDVYAVDNAADAVLELQNQGTDTVRTSTSWSLAAGSEVEKIAAADPTSTAAIDLSGNESAQTITGNAGDNRLDGQGGADLIEGGAGNDRLIGGTGIDTLRGGAGDDVYEVDAFDLALEAAGEGYDRVEASASHMLGSESEIETLSAADAASTAALDLTGNAFGQQILGNAGANLLKGGGGTDSLSGFGGDDIYHVDSGDDSVREQAGGGYDRVYVDGRAMSFTLTAGAEIEYLAALDPNAWEDLDLIGNEYSQHIVGTIGRNLINGGGGADVMDGGDLGDHYVVDDAGDAIIEAGANRGYDSAYVLTDYRLGTGVSIEQMTAGYGLAVRMTGNELNQILWGNDAANVLDGGGGRDQLLGFGGNDIFHTDGDDIIADDVGQGFDIVYSSGSITLDWSAEIELLSAADLVSTNAINLTGSRYAQTIVGNAGDNVIDGSHGDDAIESGAGNDMLIGGFGVDRMTGGAGNDIYSIDDAGDLAVELTGEGIDEVRTTLASFTLGANLENLTGTAATGQTLTGNALGNLLAGGAGADLLTGGLGDDVYVIGAGDSPVEQDGEGVDEVRTALGTRAAPFVLPDFVEKLTGTAATAQAVEGNGLDNVIAMGAGNDLILLQWGGNDTADGGAGNDYFYYGASWTAADRATGGTGTDTIGLIGDYAGLVLGAQSMTGVERLALYSGLYLPGSGPNNYHVTTHDSNVAAGAELFVTAASLQAGEVLTFIGSAETNGRFTIHGGGGNDTIAGGLGNDYFLGRGGDDQLFGAGGSDTLVGGLGADRLTGGGGDDYFRFQAAEESTAASMDRILDFRTGDRISLSAIDADGDASNGNSAFAFIGGAAFGNEAGELRAYQAEGGGWFAEADVNGDGIADLVIAVQVADGHALSGADFVL